MKPSEVIDFLKVIIPHTQPKPAETKKLQVSGGATRPRPITAGGKRESEVFAHVKTIMSTLSEEERAELSALEELG